MPYLTVFDGIIDWSYPIVDKFCWSTMNTVEMNTVELTALMHKISANTHFIVF